MSWWSMQNGRKHWRCVTAHPTDLQRTGRFSFPRGQINYVHFSLNLLSVLVTERWISYNWSKNLLWGSVFELKLENGSVSHRKIAARKVLLAEKWAVPTTPACDGYLLIPNSLFEAGTIILRDMNSSHTFQTTTLWWRVKLKIFLANRK